MELSSSSEALAEEPMGRDRMDEDLGQAGVGYGRTCLGGMVTLYATGSGWVNLRECDI